MIEKENPE